jgi:hypothetical protein
MPPETKIDCETKKHHLAEIEPYVIVTRNSQPYGYDIFCFSPETT